MNLLVEADQPGNQLDDYVSRLNAILSQKAEGILQLQNRLAHFQRRLREQNVLVSKTWLKCTEEVACCRFLPVRTSGWFANANAEFRFAAGSCRVVAVWSFSKLENDIEIVGGMLLHFDDIRNQGTPCWIRGYKTLVGFSIYYRPCLFTSPH